MGYSREQRGGQGENGKAKGKGGFTLLGVALGIIPCPYPLAMSPGEESPEPLRCLICLMANHAGLPLAS
jgi:hypothetical protein